MDNQKHIAIEVDYELYAQNETGNWDLMEKTSREHPFRFITGYGVSLDKFEENICTLASGDKFEFCLEPEEAFGPYLDEHVISLPKEIFCIDGKFDDVRIYPGNVVPLQNEDGNRFDAMVKEVQTDKVVMDLNPPLAGLKLMFKGTVLCAHEASDDEQKAFLQAFNGEDECGCGGCGGHEGHCHEDGHCHDHHKGHCGCGHCH